MAYTLIQVHVAMWWPVKLVEWTRQGATIGQFRTAM